MIRETVRSRVYGECTESRTADPCRESGWSSNNNRVAVPAFPQPEHKTPWSTSSATEPPTFPEGGRNAGLASLTGKLRRAGLSANGSKLILAVPFALNRQGPTTSIAACGVLHTITIDTDELRREPRIGWSEKQIVKIEGTTLRILANSSCSQAAYRGPEFFTNGPGLRAL
jgi:hypothetical protein